MDTRISTSPLVQLLGSLGQGRFHGTQDHITLHVLLARNGLNQHQQFAIHATTLLFQSLKMLATVGQPAILYF
jgi:hypothetical protein